MCVLKQKLIKKAVRNDGLFNLQKNFYFELLTVFKGAWGGIGGSRRSPKIQRISARGISAKRVRKDFFFYA